MTNAEFLEINPHNIDHRIIQNVVSSLRHDAVMVYPTDSVYALGCSMISKNGFEKICQIKKINPDKALLSFVCSDMSMVSSYSRSLDTALFRLINRNIPGPFTFILKAGGNLPSFLSKRKKIGFRIPANPIAQAIVKALELPILSISLHNEEDDIQPFFSDPREIYSKFAGQVQIIIDGGIGSLDTTGLVDLSEGYADIIREGSKPFS